MINNFFFQVYWSIFTVKIIMTHLSEYQEFIEALAILNEGYDWDMKCVRLDDNKGYMFPSTSEDVEQEYQVNLQKLKETWLGRINLEVAKLFTVVWGSWDPGCMDTYDYSVETVSPRFFHKENGYLEEDIKCMENLYPGQVIDLGNQKVIRVL